LLYVWIEFAPPVFDPLIELNEGYIRFFRQTNLFVCFAGAGVAIGFYQLLFRKKEEQLLNQTEELRISQAHKDMVYSIIAHDIRTPFSNFVVLAEHLLKRYDQSTDQERLEIIRAIHKSSASLRNLLENLLEWSRLQSGTLNVSCRDLNLKKLAEESVSLHSELIKEKKHQVNMDIQSGLSVRADPQMTSTIFRNLVSNAIKFTPEGGRILLAATEEDTLVEVVVEDNGYGIPAEHIENLFVLRGNRSSGDLAATNPSGLGLLLCKDFVTTMGGEIRVESEVDSGSRFLFTIPKSTNGAVR
jgi:signal transduction histidine kinase